ncbi:glycosyltransferase family 20-domain-containing protein [Chytridium lagenaria]|nr:glycosyltransferase family 20-domain-containing protein [Chytridium lagenaria]
MLVPSMVRQQIPDATIGFFLHIPFPSSEIFRCIHVRKQILQGLLGADLVGFQTYSFMRHFLMTCTRLLALESTPKGIQMDNMVVAVGIFPIGINLLALNEKRGNSEVPETIASLAEKYAGKKIVIGRDKNDYVKGVRQKLIAFERFLKEHPEWHGKVVLIQVALSTTEANENECQVSDVVARINSKYVYLHQDISFSHYLALLTIADACLITSLRDGMNLTSHEYVFAGTYGSFGAALRVNPWDTREVADAIHEALAMSDDDKATRWTELFRYVSTHTAQNFVETFVNELPKIHDESQQVEVSHIPLLPFSPIITEYGISQKRVFFLDIEGTLCPPRSSVHDKSKIFQGVVQLVISLAANPKNLVYLMSGCTREELSPFVGIPNVGVCAENGSFFMYANRNRWETMLADQDCSWRKQIQEIFEFYTDRTPGSYIEQKEISLVWHFEHADVGFGAWQAAECQNHIQNSIGTIYPIKVLPRNVNKGTICRKVLESLNGGLHTRRYSSSARLMTDSASLVSNYPVSGTQTPIPTLHFNSSADFILCIGDDRADEFIRDSFGPSSSQVSAEPSVASTSIYASPNPASETEAFASVASPVGSDGSNVKDRVHGFGEDDETIGPLQNVALSHANHRRSVSRGSQDSYLTGSLTPSSAVIQLYAESQKGNVLSALPPPLRRKSLRQLLAEVISLLTAMASLKEVED